ncbi:MAG: R2-like ligand-binding oxidase [Candidatus Dormibacteraceae bacterium]
MSYATTSARGLRWDSVPMRLFQKSKKLGIWDPQSFDFTRDRADWLSLSAVERDFILRNVALFQAGEEAVTLDLLPLLMTVAEEGRIEDEIYLTSFLWEEAKHVEFFRRWLDEVAEARGDLGHYFDANYRQIFEVLLPQAMQALRTDRSTAAQIRAATTYNMIVEGVLAETGYYGFKQTLAVNGLMPGFLQGIQLIARDESRHIRFGVYFLNRLVSQDPAGWEVMNERMNTLLAPALGVISDFWTHYDEADPPFGLEMTTFVGYAGDQFDRRMRVLERDRGKALAEIERNELAEIAAEPDVEPVAAI